jgi:hypothetical protein
MAGNPFITLDPMTTNKKYTSAMVNALEKSVKNHPYIKKAIGRFSKELDWIEKSRMQLVMAK